MRALAAGGSVLSSKITQIVVDGYLDTGAPEPLAAHLAALTDPEHDVLLPVVRGLAHLDVGDCV
ncbi:hypothetical protein [Streptomyces sp. NPDC047024]|uniref:hypothetical protein n=1 Tax=Streptomyces sp. NPDC047024 TaxID=3155476 RepID=UPI0033EC666C